MLSEGVAREAWKAGFDTRNMGGGCTRKKIGSLQLLLQKSKHFKTFKSQCLLVLIEKTSSGSEPDLPAAAALVQDRKGWRECD